MSKAFYPETGWAVQVGPDKDGTDFKRVEGNWIDDDDPANMALACKRLRLSHLRVAPDSVASGGPRLPGCTKRELLAEISFQFGFRPTPKAIQSYYRSIKEWGAPSFRRMMSGSES